MKTRDWDPDHPILRSPLAPHEPSAVLRLHRAGYRGPELVEALGLTTTETLRQFKRDLRLEDMAHRQGRPIHDVLIEEQPG